ncbi:katanin p60 ATPase-containing subunit A-like 2 [Oratosquilla oratoria]|uniref:katanin p60 ATPase-containing subunit A-like 2 n=1 Tax=Oratosquilla oratoria TaxID=337810 RepID=UPI003F7720F0
MTPPQHLDLRTLRAASQAKELAEKRGDIRRKSLLLLVHHYLESQGHMEVAKQFAIESRLNLDQFGVCENVDLDGILEEYETMYVVKNQKYPRLAKRIIVPRPTPKPHRCSSHENEDSLLKPKRDSSVGRHSPFFRRRSLPRHAGNSATSGIGRAVSDPNLSDDASSVALETQAKSRNGSRTRNIDNRKREELTRTPLVVKRTVPSRNSGEEKKDATKSSSDTDSEKGGLNPIRTGRVPRQVVDLKAMISDYTRLEDNIGDIGKGRPNPLKGKQPGPPEGGDDVENTDPGGGLWDNKMVKQPAALPFLSGEYRDLANTIQREILVDNPGIQWGDILGLEEAKRLVKEAVVYPLKYPQLFVGRFKPWRGVLLFGPPGTGKTLLAKAVATECRTTFFNISATSLVSKWRGDSEKLVRVLFEMARFHAPSTIFVDEVDALMASRQGEQEHEASRRMKTQLLVELDGLTQSNDHVFLLAASNIPWELDPAMLRRLEKRILVPLPSVAARESMFKHHLPEVLHDLQEAGHEVHTHLEYHQLASISDGYSGSDIKVVCKEAAMTCLRKVFSVLEDFSVEDDQLPELQLEAITMADVEAALSRTRPAQSNSQKYSEWHSKFGSA